jgi:hypothetical protein
MSNEPMPTKKAANKEQAEDALLRLSEIDIPAERRRLKALTGVTPERVMMELTGTVMDLLADTVRYLRETRDNSLAVRDWSYDYFNTLSEHMESIEQRIDVVEEFGGGTTISPDDAEVLGKVIVACKHMALVLLQGPFPVGERDEDGKQKLAEVLALADQADRIVGESVMQEEEDDEDLGDLDDGQDEDVEPS